VHLVGLTIRSSDSPFYQLSHKFALAHALLLTEGCRQVCGSTMHYAANFVAVFPIYDLHNRTCHTHTFLSLVFLVFRVFSAMNFVIFVGRSKRGF